MTIEERLVDAFRHADRVTPSRDLWQRVVHSIEEDRAHRRRVVRSVAAVAASVGLLIGAGATFVRDGVDGRYVERGVMDVLETVALVTLATVLGPAIRRFGRNYARDLWPRAPDLADALLRLLDLAYALVFAGYILLTVQFEYGDSARGDLLADQLADAAIRVGGLLLLVGVLHALTLMVLPLVALVHNSTQRRRPLPRWLVVLGVVVIVTQVVPLIPIVIAALVGAG